jgi:CheY-like chemotaxis protein
MTPTLLIADDSVEKADMLQLIVERAGFDGTILRALTTEEAMQIIDEQFIDLAFIDYFIPTANGPAVIASIRKKNPNAHIALVSSSDNAANCAEAKAAGAEVCICTSWERDRVEDSLMSFIFSVE